MSGFNHSGIFSGLVCSNCRRFKINMPALIILRKLSIPGLGGVFFPKANNVRSNRRIWLKFYFMMSFVMIIGIPKFWTSAH